MYSVYKNGEKGNKVERKIRFTVPGYKRSAG